jgi:ATP-dependent Clp protease adaptor protein ClpS
VRVANASVDIFAPKIASSDWSENSAVSRARHERLGAATRLVRSPTFAFDSRKYPETASMTSSGTCVPPGPSKKASGWRSGEPGADGLDVVVTVDTGGDVTTIAPWPGDQRASRQRHGTGLGAPWNVIVMNDNHNTFEVSLLRFRRRFPTFRTTSGLQLADRIHGERARDRVVRAQGGCGAYRQQLQGHGLTMSPLERS